MKVRNYVLAGSLLAAGLAWSGQSHAYTRDFWLENGTDRTINGVWVSTVNDSDWYPISGDVAGPGEKIAVHFNVPNLPCRMQLKVRFSDGNSYEWDHGFNLCATSEIMIHYDDDEQTYMADYQ